MERANLVGEHESLFGLAYFQTLTTVVVELVFNEVQVTHQRSATLGRGWSETSIHHEYILIKLQWNFQPVKIIILCKVG